MAEANKSENNKYQQKRGRGAAYNNNRSSSSRGPPLPLSSRSSGGGYNNNCGGSGYDGGHPHHSNTQCTNNIFISGDGRYHHHHNNPGLVRDLRELLDRKRHELLLPDSSSSGNIKTISKTTASFQDNDYYNKLPPPDPSYNYLKDPLRDDDDDGDASRSSRNKNKLYKKLSNNTNNNKGIENPYNIKVEFSTSTGTRVTTVDTNTTLPDIKHVPDHHRQKNILWRRQDDGDANLPPQRARGWWHSGKIFTTRDSNIRGGRGGRPHHHNHHQRGRNCHNYDYNHFNSQSNDEISNHQDEEQSPLDKQEHLYRPSISSAAADNDNDDDNVQRCDHHLHDVYKDVISWDDDDRTSKKNLLMKSVDIEDSISYLTKVNDDETRGLKNIDDNNETIKDCVPDAE